MDRESKYFGAPTLSPREIFLLRCQYYWRLPRERYMRWRYRDRVRFGQNCRIDPDTMEVHGLGTVILEDNVIIERGVRKTVFRLAAESRVTLRKGTWFRMYDDNIVFACNPGAEIGIGKRCWFSGGIFGASERIAVGEHTHIGWNCTILDSNLHRLDNDAPPAKTAPIEIGSHVWMPSNITVFPGVRIGDHCVIGAGSWVREDIPPNSFAAGRPAQVIRKIGDRDRVV